jgi:hypothetical protein
MAEAASAVAQLGGSRLNRGDLGAGESLLGAVLPSMREGIHF